MFQKNRRVQSDDRHNPQMELQLQQLGAPFKAPTIIVKGSQPTPTIVFQTYWKFAHERQQIFFRRAEGCPPPWTNDSVLQKHKFTNVYRVCDRVSQFLIREVICKGDNSVKETFFRIILFKLFNRIGTWELLRGKLNEIRYSDFSAVEYDRILTQALESGQRLYSAAYIMPSGNGVTGHKRKHRMHLWLIKKMMDEHLAERVAEARSMKDAFELLVEYPTIGNFLAYQYITDINYSSITDFSEMDFVMPGPGCMSGIRRCFSNLGSMTEPDVIRMMADRQSAEFQKLGLKFRDLCGRSLQLIDCQNIFCEVDKYSRVVHPETGPSGRTRIKQLFRPNLNRITYWFPPKWNLKCQITSA